MASRRHPAGRPGGWYIALRKHWGGLERVAALMASVRHAAAKRAQATLRCRILQSGDAWRGDHGAWELLWAKGGEGLANDGPDGPWTREKASTAGSIKGSAGTGMGHLIGVATGIALWLRRSQLLICQRGAATKPSQELAA